MEDNFLTQLVSEPTRNSAPLDFMLLNILVGDVKAKACLGHSDHELIEFSILGMVRRGVIRTALDFQRADFCLFRRLVGRILWKAVLKAKGVQEGWTLFKEEILKSHEHTIPTSRKMKQNRRPAWLYREQ